MPLIEDMGTMTKRKEAVAEPILPDNWPRMRQGVITCIPWIAAVWDSPNADVAAIQARTLRTAINRGDKSWQGWEILWTPEQLASVLDKPIQIE